MKKTSLPNNRWLPLALVPLMSVAVLAGCSSDSDPVTVAPVAAVGDTNDNDLPDAAEAGFTMGTDANSDGIDDLFAVTDADTNENGIDDSFEASITMGTDANADGIDDAAAATLAGGGVTPPNPDANGNNVPDAVEAAITMGTDADGDGIDDNYDVPADPAVIAADTNNNDVDDSFEVSITMGTDANSDGIDDAAAAILAANNNPGNGGGGESGTAGELTIGNNQGSANFDFDGSNLSGTVTLDDTVSASSVWLYTGIAASRASGNPAVQLEGSGSAYEIPVNALSDDQRTQISDNINSGNLFVLVNTSDGGTLRSNQILPADNSVTATFTTLSPQSGETLISSGEAYLHFSSLSGAFTTALSINLSVQDVDADGNPISIGTVALRSGSITGPVLATLEAQGDNVWTTTGVMGAEDLAQVTSNNAFFNAETTGGAPFLSGQLLVP